MMAEQEDEEDEDDEETALKDFGLPPARHVPMPQLPPKLQLPPKVDRYLSDLADPDILADLVASTFVSDPLHRQRILEELSTNRRLRLLIQYLREENGSAAA